MPMVPTRSTASVGVNSGAFGPATIVVALHVRPPSCDLAKATLPVPSVCHAAHVVYRVPSGPTPLLGTGIPPSAAPWGPGSGSIGAPMGRLPTVTGDDHVAPSSVERTALIGAAARAVGTPV